MTFSRKPLINKIHLGPSLMTNDDADIAARLTKALAYINPSSQNFARSLIENQSLHGWSPKQAEWARILLDQARDAYRKAQPVRQAAAKAIGEAQEARRRQAEGEAAAAKLNELLDAKAAAVSNPAMAKLSRMFDRAIGEGGAAGKRQPSLLAKLGKRMVRIKRGREGGLALYWADTAGAEGFLCTVADTGIVRAKHAQLANEVASMLNAFADPASVAREFGEWTATCMCCGRGLDHPVSVKYGIGPICNGRWGIYPSGEYVLPKGEKVKG